MKRVIEKTTKTALMLFAICFAGGAWATKLGDGITAYYDCENHTDSGETVTVKGMAWNGSALAESESLSLQWNCNNDAGIGTPTVTKFGLCYSGGGTGGRCWQSTTCAGLLPGTSSGDWSFSFWMMGSLGNQFLNTPASGSNQGFRVTKDSSSHIVVTLSETTDGSTFTTVSITSSSTYSFAGGTWHSIVVVRANDVLTLYVDGESAGTAAMTTDSYLVNNSNTLTMADSSSGGIGQGNGSDEYCIWNRALTCAEILAIADGSSPISELATTECVLPASLEETGGYVTTSRQLAFKNATLDDITAETLTGRITGGYINTKGALPAIGVFATPGEGVKTCEAQVKEDNFVKSVNLRFTQVGDNVFVSATAGNKNGGTIGETVNSTASTLVTDNTTNGYGLYNLRLPRTYESDATVVWKAGEFGLTKVGPDGNKYAITLPASGMSIDESGNLKVASSGATTGATIDIASADTQKAGVLMKYSSLAAVADGVSLATAQAVYKTGGDLVVVGVRTTDSNAYTLKGYWEISNNSGSSYDFTSPPSLNEGSGYLHFYYNDTTDNNINGTFGYAGTSISNLAGDRRDSLKWTNADYRIKKVSVGGPVTCAHSGVKAWPNVAIEKVALFVGDKYTATDISGFLFPAEATITAAGTYTLAGDNPLFASVSSEESYLINVRESATLNIPAATSVNKITFNVAEGKTLTLTGSTLTATGGINIIGKGKVATAVASQLAGTVKGDGTITYSDATPTGVTFSDLAWTGAVEFLDHDFAANIKLADYGNTGSTVCMNGSKAYLSLDDNAHDIKELKIGSGGFTQTGSYGYDAVKDFEIPAKLTGSGTYTVYMTGNATKTTYFTGDVSEFAGTIAFDASAASSRVVIGESTSRTFENKSVVIGANGVFNVKTIWYPAGAVYVDQTGEFNVNLAGYVATGYGIIIDGTASLYRVGHNVSGNGAVGTGTPIIINETGLLVVKSTGDVDDREKVFSVVEGTGTIRYDGSGYRTFPNSMFADTLSVVLEQASGIVVAANNLAVGSISGTKNLRSDMNSYNKTFTIKQAKDGVWSGAFEGGDDRLATVIVDSGATSTGTLTIAGTHTHNNNLTVNGSVNLTGTWVGATTVAGTFACSGTLTGNLTAQSGSTLDFSGATSDSRVSGALTLASGTTVKLPAGVSLPYQVATSGDCGLVDITIQIGSATPESGTFALRNGAITTLISAVIDTDKTYSVSDVFGTPSATSSYEINVTSDAELNLGEDTTVKGIKFNIGDGKTLKITGGKLTADTVVVSGGGNLAFAVANSRTLARNAVAGAPYRVWPYKFSSLTGDVSIDTSSVEVPVGYSYSDITTSQGLALEFTTAKQFGSLNINFPGGRNSVVNNEGSRVSDNVTYSGLMHGAAPVVGTSWNDVPAQNATDVAITKYIRQDGSVANDGTATITLSGVNNPYTTGSNDGDRILFGYCDDGGSPVVTIKNIPFAKYRVIAYAATDTGNTTFCPKTINDVSYSTAAAGSSATHTIAGGTGAWGDSNSRSTLAEGVNYLVSDVISGTTTVTISNPKSNLGRAAIPAVQIVEVGVADDDNTYGIDAVGDYSLSEIFPSISAGYVCEINVNESATLNIGETSVGAITFNVAAGKTLTISGTVTANLIYVYGEGKVVCSAANSLSGAIRGDGRIVFEGTLPPSGLQASFQDSASWTGTVELKDYTETADAHKIIVFSKYGNINSAVALNCVTSTMYAVSGTAAYPPVELKEIEIGEGGWSDTANEYGATMLYTAKLTGHGPITVMTRGSGTVKFIGDHTFDGSVTMDSGTGKQLAFMRTSSDTIPGVAAKAIVVAGGLDMSIASGNKWTASGGIKIDGSLTVLTSEKATATSGTISAYQDDETIGETVDATKGTTTYASIPLVATLDNSSVEISDNQASMGSVTVVGASSITGSGGAFMKSLTINDGATLTYDPVITPLRVKSAPVFTGTGKLKLAARYAGVTCGKFHLVSYPSSASVSGTLANVIDSSSFAADVSYTVTEETVGSYKQLVLKVGDYNTNAKDVSIAQFGDSITEGIIRDGYRGTPNYRIPLMQLLEAYGYKPEARGYRSVGSTDANGVPADDNYKWHTGISAQRIYTGMTSGNLRAGFMESIEAHLEQVGVTDIITLKIGTNDSIGGETADNMFEGWSNLVWKIVRMRPTSKIVVCAPVKIRSGENNAPGLRTKIADYMALTYEQGGFPNGQVTMINGINIVMDDANYYLTDNVHPNWNGHLQLANAWLPAVTNAFESMKVNDEIVHAEDTYTPQPSVASAETVAELASYRAGYIKLATFTGYNTKISTWGETPYSYVNDAYKDTPMGRVAYFVARKTTASPDTRYVWVDMDADGTTGTTLADFGVPTSATVNGVVKNLHICSNSSAIENVAPAPMVSGVKGTLMLTEKGISKDDGISTTLAPTGPYGYDWNDTIGTGSWGAMNMARIFDGATPTDHRKLLAAQMLFEFNGFNGGRQNALGIGDFAVHGPYNTPNGSVDHFNLNWTFSTAKDEMPTMDVRALETGVIEIWGKLAYTASMSANSNFSGLTFSPSLPGDLAYCDLIVNVTANSTLTFDSAISVGSIRFNINEGVTLTLANTSNLSGAVIISGPGKLQLDSSATFARMEVASNATVGFADRATLGVSGALSVASGATLTLQPAAITTASSTIISAASISGNVSVTLPSEEGVDYSTLATDTSYKIVRTPNVAFSYDGTIGATPTGWGITTFSQSYGEPFGTWLRVGPSPDMPLVYEVKDGQHPWADISNEQTFLNSAFTFAVYADLSQVPTTGKAVMVAFGTSAQANDQKILLLYKEGESVKLAVWNDGSSAATIVGTSADVTCPSSGYHLYTAVFNPADGALSLYLDGDVAASGSAGGVVSLSRGFMIGGVHGGIDGNNTYGFKGDHGFVKGIGMAFAAIRGYNAVLSADNVAALASEFTAVNNTFTHTVDLNSAGKTLTVYDATFTGECYLGVSNGALVIPAGNTVSVPHVRVQNESTGSVTVDVYGTLNVTSVSDDPNLARKSDGNADYLSYKGILLGRNGSGTGVFTIHEGGVVDGSGTWLQTIAGATGAQTLTVDGGTLKIKGFYSDKAGKSTINLQGNGVIEISQTTDRGQSITYNLGYGTLKTKASLTLSSGNKMSLTFAGANATPTTLDPYGYTMTLSSMSGNGYITVADSSDGHNGTVVLQGSTCTVILTDANAANIDIFGYTGTVLCQGTAAATIAKFNEFAGTVYFTGNVDATGVDLSGATVHVGDSCTYTADAGKEGALVLGDGAAVTLKVTKSVADYDGYIPSVSGNGTVGYYQKDGTPGALTGDDHVSGNNLLPYYNVWSASATASENTLSANAAARWKSDDGVSGVLPADNKNVAFKLENGNTVTLLVDATKTFNDIQVFGNGKLIIQQSGNNVLTVGNGLYTTANAGVQIDSGLAFANYTKLEVESALPKKVAVNCGTAEYPYGIPTVTGSGALQVTAGHALAALSLTVGNLDVDGALTLYGPSSATAITVGSTGVVNANAATTATTLTVNAGGVVNVAAGVTLTAQTLAVNGTVNMTSTSVLSGTTSLSGVGTVNWNGKNPDLTLWTTGTESTGWRGTNSVCNINTSSGAGANRKFESWGNPYSVVKVYNVGGWLTAEASGTAISTEIYFDGNTAYAFDINNGNSYTAYSANNRWTVFEKISGTGVITNTTKSTRPLVVVKQAAGYTGSIRLRTDDDGPIIAFSSTGSQKPDRADSSTKDAGCRIYVMGDGSAIIGEGKEWAADHGVTISGSVEMIGAATMTGPVTLNGGATLTFDDLSSGKKLTLSSTLAFTSGTVNIAFGNGAALYDGATLIDWTANGSAPAGTFAFSNASLADDWVLLKKADGLYVYSAKIEDSSEEEAGTVEVVDNELVATVEPTGTAVTVNPAVTKLTVSVTANAIASITAAGVATGNVVVKYNDYVTTGAYTIAKNGNVISFELNSSGSVAISDETITVVPEARGSTAISFVGDTPQFAVKAIPGLWYRAQAYTTEACNDVSPDLGTAVQATGTTVTPAAPDFSGTVRYYKIRVAPSSNGF